MKLALKLPLFAAAGVAATTAIGSVAAVAATAGLIAFARAALAPRLPQQPVVVITGGSRGLGLAIAARFAKTGARLVLAARHMEELQQAQEKLLARFDFLRPEDFYLFAADLADGAECKRLIAESIARFGRIDVLVNNAGIIEVGPVEAQPIEAYERAIRINLFAAIHTSLAAMPHLVQQSATNRRRATIVNIASLGGKLAVPHMLPYSTAKFGLVGFSEGLHAELRGKGVRVTTVCPGLMRTGGESHAKFVGDVEFERRWFDFAAKTPGIAVTAEYAANRIYSAVQNGRAEITISPQAWLAARVAGLAPETTQFVNALVNDYILPRA